MLDADLLEAVLGTPDPGQEGEGDRDQGLSAAPQTSARPALQGARRAARGPEGATRARTADERRVPEGTPEPRARRRLSRARGAADRATKSTARPRSPSSSRRRGIADTPIIVERVVNDIDEIVRDRALRRLAEHARRRARGQDGAPQDALQVQAPPGPGAVRPSVRLHPGVLLSG